MTVWAIFFIVLFLPLLGGLSIFVFRKRQLITPVILLAFVPGLALSIHLLLNVGGGVLHHFEWLPGFELGWALDRVSLVLISLVYLISLLVHLFSTYYLQDDPGIYRYFAKLGFFTTSMIGLLGADHLLLLFVFWELVGFSSYLLIGFWFRDIVKSESARNAFITNRVADVCLLAGILILWSITGEAFLSDLSAEVSGTRLTVACFGLVIGAMGKSAQFPFHTWLPHAMAGPTPVSALIHAATMVAAGVYLLIRVAPIFPVEVQVFAALVGSITALLAAFFAISQYDIKKVLAYSTISQLGYMFMAAGAGAVETGFFHLWTHAFFKAGLFLGAGVIIHEMHHHHPKQDPQDMRLMMGLRSSLPWTFVTYTLCMLALMGLPLFTGFFSKDAILAAIWQWSEEIGAFGIVPFVFATVAVLGTAYYMGRQWWLLFGDRTEKQKSSEPIMTVRLPLGLLAVGSIGFWYALNPLSHDFAFLHYIFPEIQRLQVAGWVAPLSVAMVFVGLGLGYSLKGKFSYQLQNMWMRLSSEGLYLDRIYRRTLIRPYGRAAAFMSFLDLRVIDGTIKFMAVAVVVLGKVAGLIDRWIVDGFVNFTAYISRKFGGLLRSFQSHAMQTQMFWVLVGVATLIVWGIYHWPNL